MGELRETNESKESDLTKEVFSKLDQEEAVDVETRHIDDDDS